ncbi:hypothetical protein ASPZODRAFT_11548 [Penicilliopsis zonata CBS 506.65]|uniref:alpha,alpha-trehalose-phosphate synthase (UDP-forming) n=1 Tax=Penicilliopsis zonata CBS 506.65 TaxID=1073090 RepID=A0A1L9SU08_9EURO|nr:hypothetical protein ASPZODRAFT_11548 [Penicilliopsis zonata CBS 506.65]OJJ50690.1 hypothetical protein ASPZODRAFT_11548 [Penicilliopsis zonata CBS 506.65]
MSKRNLIIVSNRLPLSVKRVDNAYTSSLSSGGLVTSLSGLTKSTQFRWFGWPGIQVQDEEERGKVLDSLAQHGAVAIFLDEELAHSHYNGFSNQILWPILHYQSGVVFTDKPWQAYQRVNELFAETIAGAAQDGDLIWVHDYHLMLLPQMLRARLKAQGKHCAVGFSLHTPFPAGDFWRSLPVRNELIEGMLSADLIGFHTDEYKQNFTQSCANILGARTEIPGKIQYKDRLICADKFIVGIDPAKFEDTLRNEQVQARIRELEEKYKGMQIIIGIDRLDYIKGLTQKLKGFGEFLDQHPEMKNKVVLFQVAVPSREDVKEYQELETELSTLVGKINGKHATPDGTPIIYMHRSVSFDELTALYSIADVCLLTSNRDGMNLVAFEYVACQARRHGVLALSEFAGASAFMKEGSITFNPANTTQVAEAIYRALTLDEEEKKMRYEKLSSFVNANTSAKWGENFINRLSRHI